MTISDQIQAAAGYIQTHLNESPYIGIVLGSGLGVLADQIEDPVIIPYEDIPNFPVSTVEGHHGRLVIGNLQGKIVLAMQGRMHYYEGHSMQQLTFPIRVMKLLGIDSVIITNACGALNPQFHPGMLMFIQDHINLTGDNPLIGPNLDEFGPRFPDMSAAYDKEYITLGQSLAASLGINTAAGVHSAVSGPNYVTKAELTMISRLGADTIGMSTIPETTVAVHCGMKVLGICAITDMAIPDSLEEINHDKVMEMAEKIKPDFIALVSEIIKKL